MDSVRGGFWGERLFSGVRVTILTQRRGDWEAHREERSRVKAPLWVMASGHEDALGLLGVPAEWPPFAYVRIVFSVCGEFGPPSGERDCSQCSESLH